MKPCANHPALKTRIRKGWWGRKDDPWSAVFTVTHSIAHCRPCRFPGIRVALFRDAVGDFRKLWAQANPINRSGMAASLHRAIGTGRDQAWLNALL